jgi:AraC family transcriptional regulator, exoenzyme S synthesis regulatory protein ExsA
MTLEVLPAALQSMSNVRPILADGNSSILHKTLGKDLLNKAIYIATPLIVYIKQGKQIIRDYDGIDNPVDENHLIFLSKGVYTVSDYVTVSDMFEAVLLFLDDKLIAKYLASTSGRDNTLATGLPPQQVHGTYTLHANEQIRRYIDSLNYVYKGAEGTDALLELKLLELLHLIAIQDKSYRFLRELSCGGTNRKRRLITDFMEQYYSHKLKIEDYALLTGRSVSTFIRDFKRSYSTTPNRWLIERKVDIAHQLLLHKNYSVTHAASEVGYENTSHFIKAYKQRYGITPKKAKTYAEGL